MLHEYVMSDHCPEYENLTMEEKLLVNIEMRHWFATVNLQDLCVPMFIFREAERRIIRELKEENERRNNDKRARKQSSCRRKYK